MLGLMRWSNFYNYCFWWWNCTWSCKGICPIFLSNDRSYLLLFCWFASTNREIVLPLDVIIQHSKEKKYHWDFFLSPKNLEDDLCCGVTGTFFLSKHDTSSSTQRLKCRHGILIKIAMLIKLCSGEWKQMGKILEWGSFWGLPCCTGR